LHAGPIQFACKPLGRARSSRGRHVCGDRPFFAPEKRHSENPNRRAPHGTREQRTLIGRRCAASPAPPLAGTHVTGRRTRPAQRHRSAKARVAEPRTPRAFVLRLSSPARRACARPARTRKPDPPPTWTTGNRPGREARPAFRTRAHASHTGSPAVRTGTLSPAAASRSEVHPPKAPRKLRTGVTKPPIGGLVGRRFPEGCRTTDLQSSPAPRLKS